MPRARARIFFWKLTKSEPHTHIYMYILYRYIYVCRYVFFFNLTTLVLVCLPVRRNLSIFAQMFSATETTNLFPYCCPGTPGTRELT